MAPTLATHATAWPARPPNLFSVGPSRCLLTAAVSNRRPLTHEGGPQKRADDFRPIAAGRSPAADLHPTRRNIRSNVPKAEAPAIRQQRVAILMVAIGIASYYSLMAEGGRHRVTQGEVSTLPTVSSWSRFRKPAQVPPVTHGPSPLALLLAFFSSDDQHEGRSSPSRLHGGLHRRLRYVYHLAIVSRDGRWYRCMRRSGGGGASPWLSNSAHGRRTGPVHHQGPTTSELWMEMDEAVGVELLRWEGICWLLPSWGWAHVRWLEVVAAGGIFGGAMWQCSISALFGVDVSPGPRAA